MSQLKSYPQIVIIGAGPAGSICAIELAKRNIPVTLIDKSKFPRDKICGDGLTPDVIFQIGKVSQELLSDLHLIQSKTVSKGAQVYSYTGQKLNFPFVGKFGMVCPRFDFDHLLMSHAKKFDCIHIIENFEVKSITSDVDRYLVNGELQSIPADLIVGADGAQSIVAKSMANKKLDRESYCAGLRVYYENMDDLDKDNCIELFTFKHLPMSYFWIFPLANKKVNVGIGMRSDYISKHKVNLKKELNELIQAHPILSMRFKQASPLETIKGFGLPLCTKKSSISGQGYLLVGDAASLIDPLSGEGIGSAIRSGRIAAEYIINSIDEQLAFTAITNKKYDQMIYRKMWSEFRTSKLLVNLFRHPTLLDFTIKTIHHNKSLKKMIETMDSLEIRKQMTRPQFYWNLMFK